MRTGARFRLPRRGTPEPPRKPPGSHPGRAPSPGRARRSRHQRPGVAYVSQGRARPAGGLARRQAPRLAGPRCGPPLHLRGQAYPPRRSRAAGRTASENSGRARRKSHRLRGAAGPAGLAAGAAPGRRRAHHRAGRSSCCAASERGASYGAPQLGPGAPPWTLAGRQGACACGTHAAPRCPAGKVERGSAGLAVQGAPRGAGLWPHLVSARLKYAGDQEAGDERHPEAALAQDLDRAGAQREQDAEHHVRSERCMAACQASRCSVEPACTAFGASSGAVCLDPPASSAGFAN